MITTRHDIAGLSAFWTLGDDTDFQKYADALKRAGLGKFTPERPTDFAALRDVLYSEFGSDHVYAVKNSVLPTFEVVTVKPAPKDQDTLGRNEYTHKMTASVTTAGNIETDTGDSGMDYRLTDKFRQLREKVAYHAVSRSLVEIVYSLSGTTLRPSGGIYWIPAEAIERWEMAANAIESAGSKNRTFALRTMMDEHTACAIREALTAEIEREGKLIETALHDPATSLKTARTQRQKADQLRQKIETYECAFTMSLADLKTALDINTGRQAIAALLDSASQGPSLTDAMPSGPARSLSFAF